MPCEPFMRGLLRASVKQKGASRARRPRVTAVSGISMTSAMGTSGEARVPVITENFTAMSIENHQNSAHHSRRAPGSAIKEGRISPWEDLTPKERRLRFISSEWRIAAERGWSSDLGARGGFTLASSLRAEQALGMGNSAHICKAPHAIGVRSPMKKGRGHLQLTGENSPYLKGRRSPEFAKKLSRGKIGFREKRSPTTNSKREGVDHLANGSHRALRGRAAPLSPREKRIADSLSKGSLRKTRGALHRSFHGME